MDSEVQKAVASASHFTKHLSELIDQLTAYLAQLKQAADSAHPALSVVHKAMTDGKLSDAEVSKAAVVPVEEPVVETASEPEPFDQIHDPKVE